LANLIIGRVSALTAQINFIDENQFYFPI
jgi:hypothetical protein